MPAGIIHAQLPDFTAPKLGARVALLERVQPFPKVPRSLGESWSKTADKITTFFAGSPESMLRAAARGAKMPPVPAAVVAKVVAWVVKKYVTTALKLELPHVDEFVVQLGRLGDGIVATASNALAPLVLYAAEAAAFLSGHRDALAKTTAMARRGVTFVGRRLPTVALAPPSFAARPSLVPGVFPPVREVPVWVPLTEPTAAIFAGAAAASAAKTVMRSSAAGLAAGFEEMAQQRAILEASAAHARAIKRESVGDLPGKAFYTRYEEFLLDIKDSGVWAEAVNGAARSARSLETGIASTLRVVGLSIVRYQRMMGETLPKNLAATLKATDALNDAIQLDLELISRSASASDSGSRAKHFAEMAILSALSMILGAIEIAEGVAATVAGNSVQAGAHFTAAGIYGVAATLAGAAGFGVGARASEARDLLDDTPRGAREADLTVYAPGYSDPARIRDEIARAINTNAAGQGRQSFVDAGEPSEPGINLGDAITAGTRLKYLRSWDEYATGMTLPDERRQIADMTDAAVAEARRGLENFNDFWSDTWDDIEDIF